MGGGASGVGARGERAARRAARYSPPGSNHAIGHRLSRLQAAVDDALQATIASEATNSVRWALTSVFHQYPVYLQSISTQYAISMQSVCN